MKSRPRGRRTPPPHAARLLSLLLSLLVVAAAAPTGAPVARAARQDDATDAADAAKREAAEFVPGEALVRFRSERAADAADAAPAEVEVGEGADGFVGQFAAQAAGGKGEKLTASFRRFGGSEIVAGLRHVKLSKGAGNAADRKQTLEAVAALSARPDVLYAEPNYIWRAKAVPNDPLFLPNAPGGSSLGQYSMHTISAPAAWDTTTGADSVVVAVIDSGVNLEHQDLVGNKWTNPGEIDGNGVDDDGNGFIDDVNGWDFANNDRTVYDNAADDDHGTHVAGIIGAQGNNGLGVTGVNWNVSLMSLKVLGPNGGDTADVISAYNYVRRMRVEKGVNVRVTNNSYGGPGFSQSALDAITQLNAAGILFVAAAGNDSRDTFSIGEFPANYNSPNVIAVASTNSSDTLSGFSNFSSRLVSMGAPGSSILSTLPTAANPNGYGTLNGTSMSSPHVAGAAALVCSAVPLCRDGAAVNSGISVANLRGALAFTGDRISALENNTTTGRRLNVRAALDAALSGDTTPPAQTALSVSSQSGRALTLAFTAPGDDGFAGAAADYDFYFVNPVTGLRVLLPTSVAPSAGGAQQQVTVNTPFGNLSGTVEMIAYDDRGNQSTSSVAVSLPQNPGTDPYVVTQSAAAALSTGGTRLAIDGDDKYLANHQLPFLFPFYGVGRGSLTVSSNGVLYFSTPPRRGSGDADDVPSSVADLQGQSMIAGLWEDLEISTTRRADAGVFVVQPDASRVIYRWQATTFPTFNGVSRGINQVNFEIELRADGQIIFRYGAGNQNLFPVVAVSGGEPSAYVAGSHTSENALKNLTDAPAVTFTPRTTSGPVLPTVQFGSSSVAGSEGGGRIDVTVTRVGDTSAASAVDYSTADEDTFTVGCADAQGAAGKAYARCDFATAAGTITFAAGETSKTITVPLIDDGHDEPAETFQVRLATPAGATLGSPNVLTVTILDNDDAGAPNPVVGPPHAFFVRQQYLDFLSREPDDAGLNAWLNVLNNCQPNPFTGPEVQSGCDRIHVSGEGFFRSDEFRLKGFYAFRFYRVAFGRLPEYTEIVSDMSFVAGATQAEVFARRAELAVRFTNRAEFGAAYPETLSPQQYVAALLGRYNLSQVTTPDPLNPDTGGKVVLTSGQLTDRLTSGELTRAQVLRAVADSDEVGAAEFNNAFVAMQYYGYLRRKPDPAGYEDWLRVLQSGDARTMVNGFLNSQEYRLRFGGN
jgi:subtilisin family serine protease